VPEGLPEEVEAQPLNLLEETIRWADYMAFDVAREILPELMERLGVMNQHHVRAAPDLEFEAQVLVRTPMPCGTLADCGVCALTVGQGWVMVCKDGPVFNLSRLK
jgi:dihydroorotate dehydrogenase electron transfer subunit